MELIQIGKIVKAHALKGEIRIYPYTDDIYNLSKSKFFYIDSVKYKVTSCSVFKNMLICKLENINSVEDTKMIMNKSVYIPKEKINEADVYYVEDLIGLEVYKTYEENLDFDKYEYLGKIEYVYTNAANDVYEVKSNSKTILIPAIKQVVKKVDLDSKKIYVKMMEGLEDWYIL